MEEVKRIEDWSDGEVTCLGCGKQVRLWFNGGELDRQDCCGYRYETRHEKINLVISKKTKTTL